MIHLTDIERKFLVGDETVRALNNVNITVHQGEYVAIMGPSGSGKSTLLNIIGLLDRPNKGVYSLSDLDTTELTDDQQASVRRHKIGFVFQFFHLVPRLTSAENVELPMILAGVDPAERKSRVQAALSSLGLSNRTKHRPDQLSGGQRQRVAIARATIMQPDIILADEPTGNLDRTSGIEVIQILEDLHTKGITLIMVTHDPDLGKRASRRVQLVDGKISRDTGDS
ncbi:MAG: ABC transporter ATP-binding protein [Deltaproteobacteria bacterium]|nr:ABC transporter ATP-binding protein [Deltaproteobacteria bacterium]MBW2014149.1 ABC transporter ATP-binding protein [Deltaproteobacteria bacterium]MBW2088567.1 ABC transporter ATP-binding protein [Deltaproteobacteria bacterium]MBW2320261.1 ABC transporter ATP-binding protein [Deltaproteobacteria bacterium]